MKEHYYLILIFFITACGGSPYGDIISQESEQKSILIQNADIFNGRDGDLLHNRDVLIKDGRIESIADNIEESETYLVIDGKGKTLMPGLIDAHVHLSGSGAVPWENVNADIEYNLQAYLYCGITSIYDLGGLASEISSTAEKIESGDIIGPSVFNTHIPITVKNGHPIPLTEVMLPWPLKYLVNALSPTIEKASDAPGIIESYIKNDIDYVKIIYDQIPPGSPQMDFEQLKALIEEAHKNDKKVFVHIGSPENALDAIKAGADVLAHGIWRGALNEEEASFIANSRIPIIYTISGFMNVSSIHNARFHPDDLHRKLVSREVLDPVTSEKGNDVHSQKVMNEFFEDVSNQESHWAQNFHLLHEKGARILVGTDSNLPGTYAGATYFQEMEELKKLGMTNFKILSAATYSNSKIFLDNPDFGIIEEGKKADVLLLDGNPLEQLEVLENPALIIKNGRVMERLL